MNGLLEFVFEGVPPDAVGRLIIDLVRDASNLHDAQQDGEDLPFDSVLNPDYWEGVATATDDISCAINLHALTMGTRTVPNATVQVLHYGQTCDVVVLLSSTDCRGSGVVTADAMYGWAQATAGKHGAVDFFGGLEPASDQQTWLYSKHGVGPMRQL